LIKDMVKKFGYDKLTKFPTNPASTTFLKIDANAEKLDCNKDYLSIIMTLM
jgi:hypothetical protein